MAKVYLDSGDDFIVANRNTVVFGTSGADDRVTVLSDVTGVELNQNIERVNLSGSSSDYRFQQLGNSLRVFSADGSFLLMTIALQDDANGTLMSFSNGIVSAKYDTSGGTGLKLNFGGAIVDSASATKLVPTTIAAPDGVTTGRTFTLTTGTDAFTGGSSGDVFNADLSSAGANTLNTLDRLDGGAGSDSLSVVLASDVTAVSLANIESVVATGSGGARILGLANAGQLNSVTASGSTGGALTVSGIAAGANLNVQAQAVGATFNYAVTAGTQSAKLGVDNVTGAAAITVNGIETIDVTASGSASTYQLSADSVSTLTFAGSANQTVTLNGMTAVSHFNASGATGNVGLTAINQSALLATTALSVTGGSGNDTLDVSSHTQSDLNVAGGAGNDTIINTAIVAADTINGGDGVDTLSTNSTQANVLDATTPTTYRITNVETLSISDQLAAGVLSTQNVATSINKVVLANTAADSALLGGAETVVGGAGSFTLDLGSSNATNTARVLGAALTVTDTGTATTDSLSIVNKSTVSSTGVALDVLDGQNITSDGYESVSINTGATTGGARQDVATLTLTPDATTAPVSLTVSGANALAIATSLTTTSTAVMTVDASAMSAQATGTTTFTIPTTSQGTGGTASITGSPGEDSITVGNYASTIIGGAGNDTLTGGTAADNIQGGDGIDSLVGSGGNDTISGGAGNDSINVSAAAGSVNLDGGDGNDTFIFAGTLSSADTVNGGDGTADVLSINDADVQTLNGLSITAINTLNNNISNVERVTFANSLANSIDVGRLDGISTLRFGTLASGTVTVSGLAATNSSTLTAALSQTLVLALGDATGTSDNVGLTISGGSSVAAGTVNVASVETATITSTDSDTTTPDAQHSLTFVDTTSTDVLRAVTVNGNAARTTLTLTGSTAVATVDGSALTGALYLTSGSTVASTITGGAGADSILGGTKADSISGGAGGDTIGGGLGADTLDGGSGANTLDTTTGVTIGTSTDSDGNVVITGVVVNLGTTAVSAATVNTNLIGSWISGALSSIASGTAGYLFGSSSNLASATVDTVSNFTRILGTSGPDYIIGGAAAESLSGAAGADYITGGAGNDTITGGADVDVIDGGTGADTIVLYSTAANNDTITFVAADDVLAFAAITGDMVVGTALTIQTVAANTSAANRVIVDTFANLGASGVNIGDQSAYANDIHYAIASDTGAIFYDADGDWTGGVIAVGTITAAQAGLLTAANFTVV